MSKLFLSTFVFLFSASVFSADRYWVGFAGGNWGATANWSATSGGVGGASVPTAADDVYFNASSVTAPGSTITINVVTANCRSINFTGILFNPTLAGSNQVNVAGDLTFVAGFNFAHTGNWVLTGTGTQTIQPANKVFQNLIINGAGGGFNLQNTLSVNNGLFVRQGTFNTNNFQLNLGRLVFDQTNVCSINLGSSTVNISGASSPMIDMSNVNATFNAGTSTVNLNSTSNMNVTVNTASRVFHIINASANGSTINFQGGAFTQNYGVFSSGNGRNLTFSGAGSLIFASFTTGNNVGCTMAGNVTINGNATFGTGNSFSTGATTNSYLGRITIGGTDNNFRFNGTNIVQGVVTILSPINDTDRVHFYRTTFNDSLVLSGINARCQLWNNCVFNGFVRVDASSSVRFYGTDTLNAGASFGNNCFVMFTNANTANTITVFRNQPVTFGDNIAGDGNNICLRSIRFEVPVTVGSGGTMNFCNDLATVSAYFSSGITFGDNVNVLFRRSVISDGPIVTGNGGTFTINRDGLFSSNILLGNNKTVNISPASDQISFAPAPPGTLFSVGTRCVVTISNGNNVFRDLFLGDDSNLQCDNNNAINTFDVLRLTRFNVIQWNRGGANPVVINNNITYTNTCGSWNMFRSNLVSNQSNIRLNSKINVEDFICMDINIVNDSLINNVGVNVSNNTGLISFPSPRVPRTLYWIGRNGNFNWSDSTRWSLSSNGPVFGCIPSPVDSVVFDINSFVNSGNRCIADRLNSFCKGMTWTTDVRAGARLDGAAANTINVYGYLNFAANQNNQFAGTFEFNAVDANTRVISCNTTSFRGNVLFNARVGVWELGSNMITETANGNITLRGGRLDVTTNNYSINLQGSWVIESTNTAITQFLCRQGTVTFDGNTNNQDIYVAGNDFYNLTINKTTPTLLVRVRGVGTTAANITSYSPVIRNNLTIIQGQLTNAGNGFNEGPYRISGNTTGTGVITITNNGTLHIDRSGTWANATNSAYGLTEFPTGWPKANINLSSGSTVIYRRHGHQNVSTRPDYGNVVLLNPSPGGGASGSRRLRYLDGPLFWTGTLTIEQTVTLIDSGYQLSGTINSQLAMQEFSELQLGNGTVGTFFPIDIAEANIDMHPNSTVIYNSGQNQNVKSLNGTGNQTYGNVIFRKAIAGRGAHSVFAPIEINTAPAVVKNLTGPINVRGNLFIERFTNLDVSAGDFQISIQGNWSGNTTAQFNSRNGLVVFNGGSDQTLSPTVDHTFYNLRVAKAGGNLILNQNPTLVSNLMDFNNGIVVASATNYLSMLDNAANGTAASAPKDASHVNGFVRKTGNDGYVFPVGNGAIFRPIEISAPSSSSTAFTARYRDQGPQNIPVAVTGAALDPSLKNVSVVEYWNLDRNVNAGGGASAVFVTLYWRQPFSGGVAVRDSLVVARWSGAIWENRGPLPGPAGRTGDNNAGTVTTSALVDNFSPFALASVSTFLLNPLPAEIMSFDGFALPSYNKLNWTVMDDGKTTKFEVERSGNGRDFEKIGEVTSLKSLDIESYTYLDKGLGTGIYYYRIKSIEFGGYATVSHIISVDRRISTGAIFTLFPNPVTGSKFNVKSIVGVEGYRIEGIVDLFGKYQNYVATKENDLFKIEFPQEVPSGIYFLLLSDEIEGKPMRLRFVRE